MNIRQNYNGFATLCKSAGRTDVFYKNGEGDIMLMDIEAFTLREKMLKLREVLLLVEEDRFAGHTGLTMEELDSYLDGIM